jgi:hypothetical protein
MIGYCLLREQHVPVRLDGREVSVGWLVGWLVGILVVGAQTSGWVPDSDELALLSIHERFGAKNNSNFTTGFSVYG